MRGSDTGSLLFVKRLAGSTSPGPGFGCKKCTTSELTQISKLRDHRDRKLLGSVNAGAPWVTRARGPAQPGRLRAARVSASSTECEAVSEVSRLASATSAW